MPRVDEVKYATTPFARVLTAYMWSKTPPWNAPKLARVLGVHRVRVSSWTHNGIVPDMDTVLAVMARLGIPVSALVDAYKAEGLAAPPLTPEEAEASSALPPNAAQPAYQPIPTKRRGGAQPRTGEYAAEAARMEQEARALAEQESEREWRRMLNYTREAMSHAGMRAPDIQALLAHIQETRAGTIANQRHIAAEHADTTADADSDDAGPQEPDQPRQTTNGGGGGGRASRGR